MSSAPLRLLVSPSLFLLPHLSHHLLFLPNGSIKEVNSETALLKSALITFPSSASWPPHTARIYYSSQSNKSKGGLEQAAFSPRTPSSRHLSSLLFPLLFGRIVFYWVSRHALPLSHTHTHTYTRTPGPPSFPQPVPFLENEQFSHCNNAPLSSAHYRHDKRWNIRGGWPPNLIWARYWSFGKWVLSALIYSLADWPLKLNIITERIFKKPGPQITSKWKY